MSDELLLGVWRYLLPLPKPIWRKQVSGMPRNITASLAFMSAEHHKVHNYVVKELPRAGKPLPPELIAQDLGMTIGRAITILDELEKHMTFLYRDCQGAVNWAYPVTVERTPHRVSFSSGEALYAA